ncbi:porin family protein [Segetibacter koreensis]|uniref:porin family protein n=1 Tax=Segetibacter koreensis TaxID=398037 RepID=UPI0003A1D712|nr:porin family protein [Segetibacter koreensis]
MKKMYLVLATFIITTAAFSQVRIGGQIIGNASSVSFKSTEIPNAKKSLQPAFGAGIVADVPLVSNLSLRPSLNYLQKKNSIEFENSGKTNKMKTSLNYLELPLDVVYTIPLKVAKVYFGAGPSLSYGLSGKMKYTGFVEGEDGQPVAVNESVEAFKKEDKGGAGLSRMDVSAHVTGGLQFVNGIFVNAGYLGSLRNLASGDGKYKNYGFQLTLGYFLK